MKLTSLFAAFQTPRPESAPAFDSAQTEQSALARQGPVQRSKAAATSALMAERLPDPPPLSETEDVVDISREASFVMAAAQFDPRRISPNELTEMAGMLRQTGGIGAADHSLLLRGPEGDHFRMSDPEAPRDLIADWQMRLNGDMNRPNLRAIGADTRALNILARVSATRDQL